jgi:hypothetical protein
MAELKAYAKPPALVELTLAGEDLQHLLIQHDAIFLVCSWLWNGHPFSCCKQSTEDRCWAAARVAICKPCCPCCASQV